MDTFTGAISDDIDHEKDAVYKKGAVYDMLTAMNDLETRENDLGSTSSVMGGGMALPSTTLWQEMLPGKDGAPVNDVLKKQYDVVYGDWPAAYNEVVLVLDKTMSWMICRFMRWAWDQKTI